MLDKVPEGCAFAPRCAEVIDGCQTGVPALRQISPEAAGALYPPDPGRGLTRYLKKGKLAGGLRSAAESCLGLAMSLWLFPAVRGRFCGRALPWCRSLRGRLGLE